MMGKCLRRHHFESFLFFFSLSSSNARDSIFVATTQILVHCASEIQLHCHWCLVMRAQFFIYFFCLFCFFLSYSHHSTFLVMCTIKSQSTKRSQRVKTHSLITGSAISSLTKFYQFKFIQVKLN